MATVADLAHDFRRFRVGKETTKALRRRIREPVPAVRRAVRARALATLPARGGLGAWVASSRLTASVRLRTSGAAILLRAGRNSRGTRSDVRAVDRGRVRHPTFGRRVGNAWHTQSVPPGWFTGPAAEVDQWRAVAQAAVDDAVKTLRG